MACPRCKKSDSYELKFQFKQQKIDLVAQVCKVCEFIWADEKEQLNAIRKHMHWMARQNVAGGLEAEQDPRGGEREQRKFIAENQPEVPKPKHVKKFRSRNSRV